jgi:alpha-tubulin suppressor-like RCC1 family protein/plastocyanin
MLLGTLLPPAGVIAEPGPNNTNAQADANLSSPVWGWGDNSHSELGDGVVCTFKPSPTAPPSCQTLTPSATDVHNVVAISVGVTHSLGLKLDSTVLAWGSNNSTALLSPSGALGDGSTMDHPSPVAVCAAGATAPCASLLSDVKQVSAGQDFSVALKSDGTVWTWGQGTFGSLGNGMRGTSADLLPRTTTPVQVRGPGGVGFLTDIAEVSAGGGHTLALKRNGTVFAWGLNAAGQLGVDPGENDNLPEGCSVPAPPGKAPLPPFACSSFPVQIQDLANVAAVSAGSRHSAVLKRDGTVWAFGGQRWGQLGIGVPSCGGNGSPTPTGQLTDDDLCGVGEATQVCEVPLPVAAGSEPPFPRCPRPLRNVKAIAAGGAHTLALKVDGTVWGWGSNLKGELAAVTSGFCAGDPPPAGTGIPCSIVPVQAAGLSDVTAIAASGTTNGFDVSTIFDHSLALMKDGSVKAWGNGSLGEIGDGCKPSFAAPNACNRSTPVTVVGLVGVSAIATGGAHVLALSRDISAVSFGASGFGEGGNRFVPSPCPQPNPSNPLASIACGNPTPVIIDNLSDVVSLEAGGSHGVALKKDGTVWAWGGNNTGQLGQGNHCDPVGTNATCLGDGTPGSTLGSRPVQVKGENGVGFLTNIKAIAAGGGHTIAQASDGTLWAWGDNNNGQLGTTLTLTDTCISANSLLTGQRTPCRSTPLRVSPLSDVRAIFAGTSRSMALKGNGTLFAWGANGSGELGTENCVAPAPGTVGLVCPDETTPVGIPGISGVSTVSIGSRHTLAIREDGSVWAWGENTTAQLGLGTTSGPEICAGPPAGSCSTKPIKVPGLSNIVSVAGGGNHSLAARSDGIVLSWGANQAGQLGNGTFCQPATGTSTCVGASTPQEVQGVSGAKEVRAGQRHNLVLRVDGTVFGWGLNAAGEVGDGTRSEGARPCASVSPFPGAPLVPTICRTSPVQAHTLASVTTVSAGAFHSFACYSCVAPKLLQKAPRRGSLYKIGVDNAAPPDIQNQFLHNWQYDAFYPDKDVTIHSGDVIDFSWNPGSINGLHNVVLLPAGKARKDVATLGLLGFTFDPDYGFHSAFPPTGTGRQCTTPDLPTVTVDPCNIGYMQNQNPAVFNPSDPTCGSAATPCVYDTQRLVNSGALANETSAQWFVQVEANTASGPVALTYYCLLHPAQVGTLTVVPDGTAASSQKDLDAVAATQWTEQTAKALAAEANPSDPTKKPISGRGLAPQVSTVLNPDGAPSPRVPAGPVAGSFTLATHTLTVWAGTSAGPEETTADATGVFRCKPTTKNACQIEVSEFLPQWVNIHKGDSVTWVTGVTQDVHTITFNNKAAAERIDPLQTICQMSTPSTATVQSILSLIGPFPNIIGPGAKYEQLRALAGEVLASNGVASDCRKVGDFQTHLITGPVAPLVVNQAGQLVPDTSCTNGAPNPAPGPGGIGKICSTDTLASSGLMTIGASFAGGRFPNSVTFNFPTTGDFFYHCAIHEDMIGVVTVTP